MLSPRAALAIVLAPFVVVGLDFSLRDSGTRLAGLAPAAFVTGCICLTVIVRISAFRRGGRAGRWTLVAITLARPSWSLVTGFAWLCAVVLIPGFVVVIEFWDG
jgi:hypothetical protein